jgi:hypothetical protein
MAPHQVADPGRLGDDGLHRLAEEFTLIGMDFFAAGAEVLGKQRMRTSFGGPMPAKHPLFQSLGAAPEP